MKSQDINKRQHAVNALSDLASAANAIGLTLDQVTITFPDGRPVVFTQDVSTGEIDWVIQST